MSNKNASDGDGSSSKKTETDGAGSSIKNGDQHEMKPTEIYKKYLRMRTFSLSNPPMPWFGLDVGGTLVKLVYFEPTDEQLDDDNQEASIVGHIRKYLTSNRTYGNTGIRDDHLQLNKQMINGRAGSLHFIRFPTVTMPEFLHLAKSKGLAACASTVCATGGGAYKYEAAVREELNLQLNKYDELQSLICGIQYIVEHYPDECYYYENPLEDEQCRSVSYHVRGRANSRPLEPPYLVVNIGSGVSILAVDGMNQFRRISGTSLGGGMFHGLCCLLCKCETFDEALELAAKGDNSRVDKLVRDIYGGDYDLFELPGDTVAASFGQMVYAANRAEASREDLARAALVTITNNIGSIARMCALTEKIDTVIFVGNFLRVNSISMRLLAHAMDYWSHGAIKAVFLKHEGYFGAVGCLMNLMRLSEARKSYKLNGGLPKDSTATTTTTGAGNASTSSTTPKPYSAAAAANDGWMDEWMTSSASPDTPQETVRLYADAVITIKDSEASKSSEHS